MSFCVHHYFIYLMTDPKAISQASIQAFMIFYLYVLNSYEGIYSNILVCIRSAYLKWTSDIPTLVHITEASQGLMKWIPPGEAKWKDTPTLNTRVQSKEWQNKTRENLQTAAVTDWFSVCSSDSPDSSSFCWHKSAEGDSHMPFLHLIIEPCLNKSTMH